MPRPASWKPPPHGTAARYLRHVTVDEDEPCGPCKAANAVKTRRYRAANLEKLRAYDKKRTRPPRDSKYPTTLAKYGLTEEGFDAILARQDGKCAICRDDFTPARGRQIDHDHAHGHTRGILCFQCNVGLGNYYDSPSLLRAAADYLEAWSVDRFPAVKAA